MFDLFRSRDKAVRYLLGAVLGLVAIAMVVTLIPGFGASSGSREQVVADIGGEPLTVREVQSTIQIAMRNRQVPQEMLQFYVPQIIDQMISDRAIAYQAKRMGFQITDQEVANAIRSMLTQYFPNGDIPEAQYRQFLQQQGQDVERFEKNVRLNLLMLRLQNIAMEGAIVTPDEVEREFHKKNDKIKVQYVKYAAPENLRNSVSVTPEEVRNYYNSNKAAFTIPEKRTVDVLVADEKKIGAAFQVPEQELRAAYQAQMDRWRTGDRVHARHILIKTGDKAEQKANDLMKQIKGGADFAELAKKNSEDPGSAANGGDLGFFSKGQMVAPFEKMAFALKPKEIGVVKSDFGWHVIQTLEKEDAKVKSFEEVKDMLATERRREAVQGRMQQVIEQARAELTKNPNAALEIANRLGLIYSHGEKISQGASLPELGTVAELETATAGVKAGQVTQVFQIGADRLGVAAVREVFPTHPAEFAEVQDQVRERVINDKTMQLANEKVKEATEKMKAVAASGGDLTALAKQLGVTVKDADYFTMEGAAEGIGPASYLAEGFSKPEGSVIGPVNLNNEVVLAKVTGKQVADKAALAGQRDVLVLDLKRRRAQIRKELFEDGLIAQLVKEGKVKKYSDVITRILAGYRS